MRGPWEIQHRGQRSPTGVRLRNLKVVIKLNDVLCPASGTARGDLDPGHYTLAPSHGLVALAGVLDLYITLQAVSSSSA